MLERRVRERDRLHRHRGPVEVHRRGFPGRPHAARVRHLRGPEEPVGTGGGEAQVLAALMADVGTYPSNTLIAVTGNSGSGKSHIVRWVYAHLRQSRPDLHVLYVPRELSNLRDLLRTLIKGLGLPDEVGQEMLTRVDDAIGSTTEQEIASRLRSAMAQALRWQFPPVAPASEETAEEREHREIREILLGTLQSDGRRRGGLADMIDIPLIWEHLEREGGTLRVIAGSIAGKAADRGRILSRFVPDDLDPRGMGKDGDVRRFLSAVKAQPGPALALLQEALDKAFPEFVGLTSGSGETLDSLFRDARIRLKESGRDLVLLFEDLVQFGPIDGALYAQFRNQPTGELAPLRVVFAITSTNWDERGPETVKRRLRHQFEVLPIQDGLDGADASDAPIRDFLARYLNLVRVGRAEVEAAWSAADDDSRKSGSWIPNACETLEHGRRCRFADECHPGFGSADVPPVGHVGLFPFNESALRRLARKMGADAGTPGRLLQVALEEVLFEAGPHIKNGTYPDRRAEDHFYYHFVSTVPALKRGVVAKPATELLRADIIWGDDRQITSSTVLEAFGAAAPCGQPRAGPRRNLVPGQATRQPRCGNTGASDRTGAPAPARSGQCLEPAPGGVPGKFSGELPRMALPRSRCPAQARPGPHPRRQGHRKGPAGVRACAVLIRLSGRRIRPDTGPGQAAV